MATLKGNQFRANQKEEYEYALNMLKERGISPIITHLPDQSIAIQINPEDMDKLPTFYLEGSGSYPTLYKESGYWCMDEINIKGLIRKINNQIKRKNIQNELEKKGKEDPKYRDFFDIRMISKTQMCGEVMLDQDENYRKIPVTLTVDEYIKIHTPETKEYTVSESQNFYILTTIKSGNIVDTVLFGKFNNGERAGSVLGKCDYLYNTNAEFQVKLQKKREKESPILVKRGDGSVTTLDRLLKGEPDLASPDTLPRLNI